MVHAPGLGLIARTAAATLWAALLAVLGLMVLLDRTGPLSLPGRLGPLIGVGAIAGAQFVFMVLVADRWFPKASRTMVWCLEVGSIAVFLTGVVLAVIFVQAGVGV